MASASSAPAARAPSISQLFDLTGRAALVTGGAKGIGEAIVRRLAEAGAAVLDAEAGESLARELRGEKSRVEFFRADCGSVKDAQAAVDKAEASFGRLDVLVNNAGIFPFSSALETTEELWQRVQNVNLKGPFFFAQAAAKAMRKAGSGGGSIVNIASIDALHPTGGLAHYDASKGGLLMLTRSLALEFAPLGIRVNTISPGGITTPGTKPLTSSAVLEAFKARIPMHRMGEPDEIARAALFLASAASSYMTGSNVVVDGGVLLA